jgi:hypothetical protein
VRFASNYKYCQFGELTILQVPKVVAWRLNYFFFGMKHDMARKKYNARTSKTTSLEMPPHPLLVLSDFRFPLLTLVLILPR